MLLYHTSRPIMNQRSWLAQFSSDDWVIGGGKGIGGIGERCRGWVHRLTSRQVKPIMWCRNVAGLRAREQLGMYVVRCQNCQRSTILAELVQRRARDNPCSPLARWAEWYHILKGTCESLRRGHPSENEKENNGKIWLLYQFSGDIYWYLT